MDKMKHPTSKLRTYSNFAQKNKTPDYLCSTVDTRKRILFIRLRLSNHDLMIEKGRPLKLKVHERTCPLCKNGLEDEIHFLMSSSCLHFRQILFRSLRNSSHLHQLLRPRQVLSHYKPLSIATKAAS